jgi:cell wall-associated NlpC family hydrolase
VRLRSAAIVLVLVSSFGILGTQSPAEASTFASRVIVEASHHKGQPYVYGAAGPTKFDCSGFTRYVFGRFGRSLPHNSAQQYNVVRHIPKSQRAPGDLLFFRNSSGRITHVAIYAGYGNMWHAPHSGTVVKLVKVYNSSYSVGRA